VFIIHDSTIIPIGSILLQPVNIIMKIAPIQATTYLTIFGSLPIDVDQSFLT